MIPPILIIFIGFVIRIALVFTLLDQGIYKMLAGVDALTFYLDAVGVASTGRYFPTEISWNIYVNSFGAVMSIVGTSPIWMCMGSVLAWFASALLLDRLLKQLGATWSVRATAASLISFMPSVVLTTFVPLREAWQMLGIALIVYSAVQIVLFKKLQFWGLAIVGAIIGGSTHIGMLAGALASIALIFAYQALAASSRISIGRLSIFAIAGALAFSYVVTVVSERTGAEGGLLEQAASYQEGGASLDARTQYKTDTYAGSGAQVPVFVVIGFLQYEFEPMPWRVGSLLDIAIFLENLVRLLLLLLAIRGFRTPGATRSTILYMLGCWMVTELIWSLGTIAWGTAIRHHLPTLMPLILAGLCVPFRKGAKLASGVNPRMATKAAI